MSKHVAGRETFVVLPLDEETTNVIPTFSSDGLAMPRFYFHFRNGEDAIDKFGLELADEVAAREEATRGARSVWSERVRAGELPIHERVEVTDETGAIVFVGALRDLVKFE